MGVYHSKFSDNERVEVWNGILNGKFKFVVGVRSSIFLPFDNLGLIIVDEEHDSSYKQHEPAPRYHARDVAMVMAKNHHAKVLLGSATPSLESFFQTAQNHYGLVTLQDRFGEAQLPDIQFADLLKKSNASPTRENSRPPCSMKSKKPFQRKSRSYFFKTGGAIRPWFNARIVVGFPSVSIVQSA